MVQVCLVEALQEALQVPELLEVKHNLDQQSLRNILPSPATKMPTSEVRAMDYTIANPLKNNS